MEIATNVKVSSIALNSGLELSLICIKGQEASFAHKMGHNCWKKNLYEDQEKKKILNIVIVLLYFIISALKNFCLLCFFFYQRVCEMQFMRGSVGYSFS